jgi:hypothetical protein
LIATIRPRDIVGKTRRRVRSRSSCSQGQPFGCGGFQDGGYVLGRVVQLQGAQVGAELLVEAGLGAGRWGGDGVNRVVVIAVVFIAVVVIAVVSLLF